MCQTYWYPLYACARRQGCPPAEAEDLTQAFFARLVERNFVERAEPEKGRFRTFLLTVFKLLALRTNLVTKEALDRAATTVRQVLGKSPEEGADESLRSLQEIRPLVVVGTIAYVDGLVFVVAPCLAASLLFRGGVLAFALGIAFVNRKGARCSRLRVTARNLFAWREQKVISLTESQGRIVAEIDYHGSLQASGNRQCGARPG